MRYVCAPPIGSMADPRPEPRSHNLRRREAGGQWAGFAEDDARTHQAVRRLTARVTAQWPKA